MSEIKDCPFCGNKAYLNGVKESMLSCTATVKCNTNMCMGNRGFQYGDEAAIAMWNVRVIDKELEQLRKEKETWLKVCKYEKEKWKKLGLGFPISSELKEHLEDIDKLLGE